MTTQELKKEIRAEMENDYDPSEMIDWAMNLIDRAYALALQDAKKEQERDEDWSMVADVGGNKDYNLGHRNGYQQALQDAEEVAEKYKQPPVTEEEVLLPKNFKYEVEGFNKACEAIAQAIRELKNEDK